MEDLKAIRRNLREIEEQIAELALFVAVIRTDLDRRSEARREAGEESGDEQ